MAVTPGSLSARRAAARARRRRRIIAALAILLAAGAAAGWALGLGGGRAPVRPSPLAVAPPPLPPVHRVRSAMSLLEARGIANIERLARLGLPVYCAGPHGNALAFTFDDGPGPYTYLALRKLRRAHEQATFFVVGKSMRAWPGWVQKETALATIGDHTMTHPYLLELSPSEIRYQLEGDAQMIERETGQAVHLFRPPYGSHDAIVDRIARQLGLLEILWSVDSADSLGANWAGIIRNVEAGMRPGAIILMHENRGQTIRALTTLLPELHRRHLRSVSLVELFAIDPPSVAQVREGGRPCDLRAPAITGT